MTPNLRRLGRAGPEPSPAGPRALVYRGPASVAGCPEAVAALLASSKWHFDVHFVGPDETLHLTDPVLSGAALYAQPGGGTLQDAYRHLKKHKPQIQNYVRSGGRYLGICLGGYLAGATPGFALIPGDADQYASSPGASITTTSDTIAAVRWRGRRTYAYFQDGPYFWLHDDARATVLATYPDGRVAALTAPYGQGRVAVVGPHPEADRSWYDDSHLTNPDGIHFAMGHDLIDTVMT
nr:BPL-N domain-containing protein [Rhodococcus wratislaviensis]GLK39508.1 hypothetical protein GCM10017611_63790 [Rhodococcus wratislaviensis]